MILSSDELAILEYLRSWKGTAVSMVEICRCADGRRRFKESPHWAKGMMGRLVEANLIEVNDRGHYRCVEEEEKKKAPATAAKSSAPQTVGEDYFPGGGDATVVGEDYFPASSEPDLWVSPQMAEILKKAGKKFGGASSGK